MRRTTQMNSINKLIQRNKLTLEEVGELPIEVIEDLTNSNLCSLIMADKITVADIKHLTLEEKANLSTDNVCKFIIEDKISVEEAKMLTTQEKINLDDPSLFNLIMNGLITLQEGLSVSKKKLKVISEIEKLIKNNDLREIFIKNLLHLSEEKIEMLYMHFLDLNNKFNTNPNLILSTIAMNHASLDVLAILMLITIEKLREIHLQTPDHLPIAMDIESSMRDEQVRNARERFEILSNKYNEKFNQLGLEEIEKQIRIRLLHIIKQQASSEEQDLKKKLEALLTDNNIESIASLSEQSLLSTCRKYFTSNETTSQIAFRAYDPGSQTVAWPNLLTPPNSVSVGQSVFTTAESRVGMIGAATLDNASMHVRKYAALCFLASQDDTLPEATKEEIWQDFISYIAEIRRSHNDTSTGTDNPSCFPGTISRIAQSINKMPEFKNTNLGIEIAIRDAMRTYINMKLSQSLNECETSRKKAQLYFSLMMLGLDNAQKVIENPVSIFSILPEFDEDKFKDPTTLMQEYIQTRARFISQLMESSYDPSNPDLITYVKDHLKTHGIPVISQATFNYLIDYNIAQLPSLGISITKEQQKAMQLQDESTSTSTLESNTSPESIHTEEFDLFFITPNPAVKGNKTYAISDYWLPLFRQHKYNALMPLLNNNQGLCKAIIEERFVIKNIRQMTIENIIQRLKTIDNAEIITNLLQENPALEFGSNIDVTQINTAINNIDYYNTNNASETNETNKALSSSSHISSRNKHTRR